MTAYSPQHASACQPSPLAEFFRRLVRQWRWKRAVPAVAAAGAATALLTPPDGTPVLEDRWVSQVRQQWNAWHDTDQRLPRRTDTMPAGFPALSPAGAHANAMHEMSARYLPAPPHRPVNGRRMPDQPRQRVYGQTAQLNVERDAAIAAGTRARGRYQPPPRELLQQLLEGIEAL